jgi:DNA-binding NarL/FixJ family response regulator
MKGLPPNTIPLRVAVLGDFSLVEALSEHAEQMILSPVETNLEISARVTQADVLVVDLTNNAIQGLQTIRELTYKRPVLALVAPGGSADALKAGAKGAIRKDSKPAAIAAAIEALNEGLAIVDPTYLAAMTTAKPVIVGDLMTPGKSVENDTLTKRENEVLVLLADGLSNKEIAAKLSISEHTAKFHVNSILQKMNAQKRVEAVVRAAKMGLINL